MNEFYRVQVGDEFVGYASYGGAADVWFEHLVDRIPLPHQLVGRHSCTRPPTMERPHRLRWAALQRARIRTDGEVVLSDHEDDTFTLLYCPECKCIVAPPMDGYQHTEYTAEYFVDFTPAPATEAEEK